MKNKKYQNQFNARIMVAGVSVLVVALLLTYRGVQLNVLNKDFLQQQGYARYLRVVDEPAHRGMIADRNGDPLAISTPVQTIWANPGVVLQAGKKLHLLAAELDRDFRMLEQQLKSRSSREFIYLQRHAPPDLVAKVTALKIPGVGFQREYKRFYPSAEVTAHVVGFTDIDDRGQEGLELEFDKTLIGIPGSKRVVKDRLGRIVENVENVKTPQHGKAVILSLDRRIQYLAFKELKKAVKQHQAESGSVVVIDAQTGEVLAMTNYPAFNPNNRQKMNVAHLRNRAITDVFEPGSTVKPFTIAAGLETGQYSVDSIIDTSPGVFRVGTKSIRDHHNYGPINLQTILQKSSNIGASKIALSIKPRWLWKAFSAVGFGMPTGSQFPGESLGTLSDYHQWHKIDRASLSFGYGVSVTALQLARAYTVFANDEGKLKSITLVRRSYIDENNNGKTIGISDLTLLKVRTMLETVVQPDGTGSQAAVNGYRVAGKTGTVKKLGADGYLEKSYVALFAGLAPASNPRLVMSVIIDDPKGKDYYGGIVAAPVFSKVMAGALRILNVQPDRIDRQQTPHVAMLSNGQ